MPYLIIRTQSMVFWLGTLSLHIEFIPGKLKACSMVRELQHEVRTKAGWAVTALLQFPSVTHKESTTSEQQGEDQNLERNKLQRVLKKLWTGITWASDFREVRVNLPPEMWSGIFGLFVFSPTANYTIIIKMVFLFILRLFYYVVLMSLSYYF